MGTACSSGSAFRFKNLVVAVYPKDVDGEPSRDAMGKLQSYVQNNPERIPRVCRKVSKLIAADMKRGDVKRVSVGVHILRDLIENATELETFVPVAASVSIALLENGVVENRIGAAEIISTISCRIVDKSSRSTAMSSSSVALTVGNSMEQARRLVADNTDRFSSFLRDMMIEGVGTNDIIALHCRYAAIVALGNLSLCIQTALSAAVSDLMPPVLSNFHHLLKESSVTGSSKVNQRRKQRSENLSSGAVDDSDYKPVRSVVLPVEAGEKDVAFFKACLSTIAALATTCTSSTVANLLSTVSQYFTTFHGWSLSRLPPLIYRAITFSLQSRSQPLGINVCHHLCEVTDESAGTERYPTALLSLAAIIPLIPMTGGRPAPIVEVLKSSITSGLILHPVVGSTGGGKQGNINDIEADRSLLIDRSKAALIELTRVLVRRIAAQGNTIQLARMASELSALTMKQTQKPLLGLILEYLLVVAPYVGDLPSSQEESNNTVAVNATSASNNMSKNSSNSIIGCIRPFLGLPDELRNLAARILAAMVAQDTPTTQGLSSANSAHSVNFSYDGLTPELVRLIDDVKVWISKTTQTTDHCPQSIVEVTNVLTSVVFRLRWDALPIVIPWIFFVQKLNSSTSGGVDVETNSLPSHTTALQQAWLFASVVILKVVGDTLNILKLSAYAIDILSRRCNVEPSEIGTCFLPRLANCTSTSSGMTPVDGERETQLASLAAHPVTNLITLSTSVVYLSQPPEVAKQVLNAFGISDVSQLENTIQDLFCQVEQPTPRLSPAQQRRASNGGGASGQGNSFVSTTVGKSSGEFGSSGYFLSNSPSGAPSSRGGFRNVSIDLSYLQNRVVADIFRDSGSAHEKLATAIHSLQQECGGEQTLTAALVDITSTQVDTTTSNNTNNNNAQRPTPIPLTNSTHTNKSSHKETVHRRLDPVQTEGDGSAGSTNTSFFMNSSSSPPGRSVLSGSIVLSTAKTLRLGPRLHIHELPTTPLQSNNSTMTATTIGYCEL